MLKHCIISSSNICFIEKNKTFSIKNKALHIILTIMDSLEQQIHYNSNIFRNKCYSCNEGSLYHLGLCFDLGGSIGCASDWYRGCGFDPAGLATFFHGDLITKYFLQ